MKKLSQLLLLLLITLSFVACVGSKTKDKNEENTVKTEKSTESLTAVNVTKYGESQLNLSESFTITHFDDYLHGSIILQDYGKDSIETTGLKVVAHLVPDKNGTHKIKIEALSKPNSKLSNERQLETGQLASTEVNANQALNESETSFKEHSKGSYLKKKCGVFPGGYGSYSLWQSYSSDSINSGCNENGKSTSVTLVGGASGFGFMADSLRIASGERQGGALFCIVHRSQIESRHQGLRAVDSLRATNTVHGCLSNTNWLSSKNKLLQPQRQETASIEKEGFQNRRIQSACGVYGGGLGHNSGRREFAFCSDSLKSIEGNWGENTSGCQPLHRSWTNLYSYRCMPGVLRNRKTEARGETPGTMGTRIRLVKVV